METDKGKLKRCPKCGKFFTCQGDEDCWCETMQIPKKSMVRIMQEYSDCICRDCLKEYESE